jgi:hypothetical protein
MDLDFDELFIVIGEERERGLAETWCWDRWKGGEPNAV